MTRTKQTLRNVFSNAIQGRSQDFRLERGRGGVIVFIEKCSLLVDRLRRTSKCYIELRLCYKFTTLLFSLLSQSIQCLSHEIKLLQPLCTLLNRSITEALS